MHKKLASELTSLAHSILRIKDKDDVFVLKEKAHELYERLSVLAYVEEYINTTPQAFETKEELLAKVEKVENIRKEIKVQKTEDLLFSKEEIDKTDQKETAIDKNSEIEEITENKEEVKELNKQEVEQVKELLEEVVGKKPVEEVKEKSNINHETVEEITEQPFDEIENIIFNKTTEDKFDETSFIEENKVPTLEDELKDTISVDVTADLFTKVPPKKSLNDKLQNTIQIGLNDRIAFVKHLFKGSSGDFNRVVSQLNTFDTEQEAKKFISKNVKPDYDWSEKEEYEVRFLEIIERRFI